MTKILNERGYSECLEDDVLDLLIEYGVPNCGLETDIAAMINDAINGDPEQLYVKAMQSLQAFIDSIGMDEIDNFHIATEAMNKLKEVQ